MAVSAHCLSSEDAKNVGLPAVPSRGQCVHRELARYRLPCSALAGLAAPRFCILLKRATGTPQEERCCPHPELFVLGRTSG